MLPPGTMIGSWTVLLLETAFICVTYQQQESVIKQLSPVWTDTWSYVNV